MKYLYETELLHSQNHGYRRCHGTITAILEAQEAALEAMDDGDIMGIVTLDQSAAFDVVEHRILDAKMKLYGFDDHSLNWYEVISAIEASTWHWRHLYQRLSMLVLMHALKVPVWGL